MSALRTNVPWAFGLVTGALSVHSAIASRKSNVTVCTGPDEAEHEPIRISQRSVCSSCGEVGRGEVKKAREVAGGLVVLSEADLATVGADAASFKNKMEIMPHPASEVEVGTVPGEKAYYLTPAPGTEAVYNVLGALIMAHPELAFMTRFTLRTAMNVFRVMAVSGTHGPVLLMQERVAAESMKAVPDVAGPSEQHPQLYALAETILATGGQHAVVRPFDIAAYRDSSAEALEELLATRTPVAAGGQVVTTTSASDALAQLEAMVAAQAAASDVPTSEVEPAGIEEAPKPARRRAAKKTAASAA